MTPRFRKGDRVQAYIDCLGSYVPGTVKLIEENKEGETTDIIFLVVYDVNIDGKREAFHAVDELRLIQTNDDKAPISGEKKFAPPPLSDVSSLPTYSDYVIKVAARTNTAFDALFCKEETQEAWKRHVTIEGQHALRQALRSMTLLDISQLYGELQRQVLALNVTGKYPEMLNAYRHLAQEILEAVVTEACYRDLDGAALQRFEDALDPTTPALEDDQDESPASEGC
jgi:hypothetical protein